MKKIHWFIVLLALVFIGWLAFSAHKHPGYVLIAYRGLTLEMTLWFGVLGLALMSVLLYSVLRVGGIIWHLPAHFKHWRAKRALMKDQLNLGLGMLALMAPDWAQVEYFFLKGIQHLSGESKSLNHPLLLAKWLWAAKAAYSQGKRTECRQYLSRAEILAKQSQEARWQQMVLLAQARYQNFSCTMDQLLVLDNLLSSVKPKYIMLPPEAIESLRVELAKARFDWVVKSDPLESVDKLWQGFSPSLQSHERLVLLYADFLKTNHRIDEAAAVIQQALRTHGLPTLIRAYGQCFSSVLGQQIKFLLRYVKRYTEVADVVYLAVAQLYFKQGNLEEAKCQLEASLEHKTSPAAYRLLAEIHESRGQLVEALSCYKQACEAAS